MKQIILTSTLIVFFFTLLTTSTFAKENKNEKTDTFIVSMDCQGCVNKIEGNISYEKGVKDLKVSLDNKECKVTYRTDKTSPEALIEAFSKLGYDAKVKKVDAENPTEEKEEHKQNMTH